MGSIGRLRMRTLSIQTGSKEPYIYARKGGKERVAGSEVVLNKVAGSRVVGNLILVDR